MTQNKYIKLSFLNGSSNTNHNNRNVIIVVWISLGHILMLTVLESNFKLCLRLRLTEKSQKLLKEPKLVRDTDRTKLKVRQQDQC